MSWFSSDPELGVLPPRSGGLSLDSIPFLPKRQPPADSDSWMPDFQGELSLGWKKRLIIFGMSVLAAGACLVMACVSLPLLVLRPAKFAFFYSMANVLLLVGITLLLGIRRCTQVMCQPANCVASTGYIVSLLLTLYSAIVLKMYLITLVALGAQLLSIFWFVAGKIPFLKTVLSKSASIAFSFFTR
eukprot:c1685_g1_i2.p1 GENE.c1685_g1_i2~~c1685_g1_i2.p1  ORF type:complete len:187 (+),score=27.78 c1685_g1_i2:55-615(+)